MKIILKSAVICVILVVILAACTPAGRYVTDKKTSPRSRYYRTLPLTERIPPSGENFRQGGSYRWVASYYGKKFHGKKTANGEIFDMHSLTCAHRELPFGTILRVINPDNRIFLDVRVNDRGPFIEGRDLDLSQGAAEQIGMLKEGVKELHIEILHLPLTE
jgi:rare lipoprotein A